MKRLLVGGLVALGLAVTAAPAWADCYFESTCCRHITFVRTCKNRCFSCSTTCNPLPCISSCSGGGCSSAAPFPAPLAYAPHYGYAPAVVAAAPAATTAPAASNSASQPSFQPPQPRPAASASTGVQQAGYFYYGQTNNAGYGYNAGYNYGAGTGYGYSSYGYAQAPNYWY